MERRLGRVLLRLLLRRGVHGEVRREVEDARLDMLVGGLLPLEAVSKSQGRQAYRNMVESVIEETREGGGLV